MELRLLLDTQRSVHMVMERTDWTAVRQLAEELKVKQRYQLRPTK